MTYCLGIRVRDGLVCLADGRITSGALVTAARKLSFHGAEGHRFAVMTSGLRSVRDKTLAYFDRLGRSEAPNGYGCMLDALDAYTRCLRRVHEEDDESLARSQLTFNLHTIIAGALPEDEAARMFLVYPEGNWVEVGERTPFLSIGEQGYGKPILDRALSFDSSIATALKLAYLSFDSTRFSSANVGYPLDLATFGNAERVWRETVFDMDDLAAQRRWWSEHLGALVEQMPDGPWLAPLAPAEGDRVTRLRGTTTGD